MESNPNQRTITTKKEPCNKDNLYTSINLEALKKAMNILKPTTFEMWLYLSWCNFSASTYQSAFKELIETGYLVQSKSGSNHYDFYELPQEKEEEKPLITMHKADNSFKF